MARRWLVKTAPLFLPAEVIEKHRPWTYRGVTSRPSLGRLARMRRGDEVLVQHTGHRPRVLGITRVRKGPHPDPEGTDPTHLAVGLAAIDILTRPVELAELRAVRALADWELLTFPRLSVASVPAAAWRKVLQLGRRR